MKKTASKSRTTEFSNLVIKSGNKNLLDIFTDTVSHAINAGYSRHYGDSKYFFLNIGFVEFDSEICLFGRMVKDTIVRAEQQLVDDQLVESNETMPIAPSSIFVIFLGVHRMAYIKEHAASPNIESFARTLIDFLKKAHREKIEKMYATGKAMGASLTKKHLVETHPYPTVNLTPVATSLSVETFINTLGKVDEVVAEILPTNHEIDNDELFAGLRDASERIQSNSTKIVYKNNDGLDKKETAAQVTAIAEQGNHNIKIKGTDSGGAKVNATNDDIGLKVPIDASGPLKGVATRAKKVFDEHIKTGVLKVMSISPIVKSKLDRISDFLK